MANNGEDDKKEELKWTDWSKGYKTFHAGKFAPKLTFQQQCAVWTFFHKFGISINVLAATYGIAPRTVSVLVNHRAKEYQRVKKEARRLEGVNGMYQNYVFDGDIQRVQETIHGKSKLGIVSYGGQDFTIVQNPETKKWISRSIEVEVDLGRFDTWKEAWDECIKFVKAGQF